MIFKADKIKELCKEKGISIIELAARIDVSKQALYSNLKNNSTTILTLEKICNALGVSPNYFFDYDTKNPTSNSINLNYGSGIAQYSAGNIRTNQTVVSETKAASDAQSLELENLRKELGYLQKQIIDKDEMIATQKEFIENLKRQIK